MQALFDQSFIGSGHFVLHRICLASDVGVGAVINPKARKEARGKLPKDYQVRGGCLWWDSIGLHVATFPPPPLLAGCGRRHPVNGFVERPDIKIACVISGVALEGLPT